MDIHTKYLDSIKTTPPVEDFEQNLNSAYFGKNILEVIL